jgi:hypothetical protein
MSVLHRLQVAPILKNTFVDFHFILEPLFALIGRGDAGLDVRYVDFSFVAYRLR